MEENKIVVDLPEIDEDDIIGIETNEEKVSGNILTTFGGADATPVLNGKAVGSIQSVRYKENLLSFDDSVGQIDSIIFDRSEIDDLRTGFDEFMIIFANEYGQSVVMFFDGFMLKERKGGVDIDDVFLTEEFTFTFTKVRIEQVKWTFDRDTCTYKIVG